MSEAVNNIDKMKPEDGSNMNSNPGSSKVAVDKTTWTLEPKV